MSIFSRNPALRWTVPLLAAVVFLAGGAGLDLIRASAREGLPERSAAQLLVDVQNARVDGLSGTIAQSADLGLPELPGAAGSGSSDLSSLLSGSHTLRVWYDGPERVRVALMGSLGESDVIRSGSDLWTWSSNDKSATHRTVHGRSHHDAGPSADRSELPLTPQQAADRALEAIDPSTKVSTDGTAVVAGRSAYELVLEPRDPRSTVESVRIAIDGKTHVPTRVEVFAKGVSKPAFEVGFTAFDPTRPDPAVFRFNPPPGTRVTEEAGGLEGLADESGRSGAETSKEPSAEKAAVGEPRVIGSGWTSVVVVPMPAGATSDSMFGRMLERLPRVSGSWGTGHLLRGTLFSALLTEDGRLVAGAVAPDLLYEALAAR